MRKNGTFYLTLEILYLYLFPAFSAALRTEDGTLPGKSPKARNSAQNDMKNTLSLTLDGQRTEIRLAVSAYIFDGTLCVDAENYNPEDRAWEPYGHVTVNIGSPLQSVERAFLRIYSPNDSWVLDLIRQTGIARPVLDPEGNPVTQRTGHVTVPLYEFDLEKLSGYIG